MAMLHTRLIEEAAQRLADFLDIVPSELTIKKELVQGDIHADLVISHADRRFIVECKTTGEAAPVAAAARQVRLFAAADKKKAIPLVVVPYMGEVGRRACEKEEVYWFDLSGNAFIRGPGLRIEIEGKPNRFKRAGRPKSLFAPKSARITRWLLMKNDEEFSQRELARLSHLDEGFTSRIVRGLEEQDLITRSPEGLVQVRNYDALLEAWREAYDFSKHHILRGHIAARSSDEVLRRITENMKETQYAVTGLAGAWLLSGFAGFRLVVLYMEKLPTENLRKQIGFHEAERGENVWIVQPDDCGVFQGSEVVNGILCAHPVQVYMDLKGHPERSKEAADELRKKLLKLSRND